MDSSEVSLHSALRLGALRDAPDSFGERYEPALALDIEALQRRATRAARGGSGSTLVRVGLDKAICRTMILAIYAIAIALISGCGGDSFHPKRDSTPGAASPDVRTDAVGLDRWIKVPHGSTATWEIIEVGDGELGLADIILVAVSTINDSAMWRRLQNQPLLRGDVGFPDSILRPWAPLSIEGLFTPSSQPVGRLRSVTRAFDPSIFLKDQRSGFYLLSQPGRMVFLFLMTS